MNAQIVAHVELPGRDCLDLQLEIDPAGQIVAAQLTGQGCPLLLRALTEWRPRLSGKLTEISAPQGADHVSILLRELIARAQGIWQPPITAEELCHCRAVPTQVVDHAIVAGAHDPRDVSRQTSASTGCGTCRPNVEKMIAYRLGS